MRFGQLKWQEVSDKKRTEEAIGVFKTNLMQYTVTRVKFAKTVTFDVEIKFASGEVNDTFTCTNKTDLEIYLNEKENEDAQELTLDWEEE